jgi:hypothetical protein
VAGVAIPALRNSAILDSQVTGIPNYRAVIATPEIRQGTFAGLIGVTVPGLHITAALNSHIVIATPEIR